MTFYIKYILSRLQKIINMKNKKNILEGSSQGSKIQENIIGAANHGRKQDIGAEKVRRKKVIKNLKLRERETEKRNREKQIDFQRQLSLKVS